MIPYAAELAALVAGVAGWALGSRAIRGGPGPARTPEPPPERAVDDDGYDALLRALPLATLTVDAAGKVRSLNEIAEALFRTSLATARGRALIEVVPSLDLERVMQGALRGETTGGTIVFARPDGETTIRAAAVPIRGGGAAIVGEDVTTLIAVERVRRDFLADVSHELRTPLSSIKLMAETLVFAEGDADASRMFLPKMVAEIDRMTALVEDLLDLARSESPRVQLHREDVDLRGLAAAAIANFRPRAESIDVALRLEAGEPVVATVDIERTTQVLVNLIDNALRHTSSGGKVLVSVSSDGEDAVVVVDDDGVGIPFADLPHIFERFYVVDRSRAREQSGTGLGLAIVKQIVEAHGGTIRAESELAVGSRFECRFPLKGPIIRG